MGFIEYVLADIVGVVVALLIYDLLVEIKWIKLGRKSWRYLERQLLGLFRSRKPTRKSRTKSNVKGDASDVY